MLNVFRLSQMDNRGIFIVITIVACALILDTSVIKTSDLVLKSISRSSTDLFLVLSIVILLGQYVIYGLVKARINQSALAQNPAIRLTSIATLPFQVVLSAVLIYVLGQITVTSRYDVIWLSISLVISYSASITMMTILAQRFFAWFRINKNLTILLYALASIAFAANALTTLFFVPSVLADRPAEARANTLSLNVPHIDPNSFVGALNSLYVITTLISFVVMWAASASLLRYYSTKVRKSSFWIAISAPLVFFSIQFLSSSLNLISPLLSVDPAFYSILFTVLFVLGKPIGGILFAIAFWTIARKMSLGSNIRNYLIIAAFGLVLLFTSNQAIVLVTIPYPPFGLITILFMGLSSYLVLVGIYSSAITLSQDTSLRMSIQKLAINELKLIDKIGSAEKQAEIERTVFKIAKRNADVLKEQTGVEPSISEEEMKQYLDQLIQETKGKQQMTK